MADPTVSTPAEFAAACTNADLPPIEANELESAIAVRDAAIRQPLEAEIARLRHACSKQNYELSQELGKALGYPRFADDQKNFPGASGDEVCVGEHVAETLAMEAVREIARLKGEADRLFDLVRYSRHELHEASLITDEEFSEILEKGSVHHAGSVKRLESYDAIRAERDAAREEARKAREDADALAKALRFVRREIAVRKDDIAAHLLGCIEAALAAHEGRK